MFFYLAPREDASKDLVPPKDINIENFEE